jgi:hypothetical protein
MSIVENLGYVQIFLKTSMFRISFACIINACTLSLNNVFFMWNIIMGCDC